ncbi:hypothetical protein PMN64_35650, partial [Bradyrhizobium sp. UFLA01-814]|uniref:hypothetical protein n=1 Tax=Bradyrhizobium sp. UFLA01-814 TaxID=3023480 RepID=UPI00398BBC4D
LWDSAGWCSVFYLFDPTVAPLPVLGLGFRNKDAAEKIFKGWRKLFGVEDKANKLRVTILKGIERSNPAAYRVYIGTNIDPDENANSLVMMVGRHQTMTPENTRNLDGFLRVVGQSGPYLLTPAHFISETEFPDIGLSLAIMKTQLVVKNAWEVSLNDLDVPAITHDDDPFIPADVETAPVTEVLETIRKFAERHRD